MSVESDSLEDIRSVLSTLLLQYSVNSSASFSVLNFDTVVVKVNVALRILIAIRIELWWRYF